MHRIRIYLLTVSTLLIAVAVPSFSFDIYTMADQSTWRCPGGIVAVGDSDSYVNNKCGNPTDVVYLQDVGPVWIYRAGQSRFMYYLGFQNGRLQRIVSAPCRNNDPECYQLR